MNKKILAPLFILAGALVLIFRHWVMYGVLTPMFGYINRHSGYAEGSLFSVFTIGVYIILCLLIFGLAGFAVIYGFRLLFRKNKPNN